MNGQRCFAVVTKSRSGTGWPPGTLARDPPGRLGRRASGGLARGLGGGRWAVWIGLAHLGGQLGGRDRLIALVDPVAQQLDRRAGSGLEAGRDPAGLAKAIPGRL